jgi:prepilin-type N-terminal cleavage/methylation domain-containing protein
MVRPWIGRSASSRGFSLLEVCISLLVVAIALATLAPAVIVCIRTVRDVRDDSRALVLARSRLEQLRSLRMEQPAGGGAPVTDTSTDLSQTPATRGGEGLTAGDGSSVWSDRAGSFDRIDRNATPASDIPYIRRWGVSAVGGFGPDPPLLLQVMTRSEPREAADGPRAAAARRPGDAWMFVIKGRMLR